jgi:hypothetical protein
LIRDVHCLVRLTFEVYKNNNIKSLFYVIFIDIVLSLLKALHIVTAIKILN